MKRMIAFGTVLLFCLGLANANATLITENNSTGTVVYDNVAKVYWMQNTQFLASLSYADQLKEIGDINSSSYFGITTWKLATLDKMTQLWSNPAIEFLKFYRTYVEGGTDYYYGRYDAVAGSDSHFTARIENPIWQPANSLITKMPLETEECPDLYSWQTAPGGAPGFPAAWVYAELPSTTPHHHCGNGHHPCRHRHHGWTPDQPFGTSDQPFGTSDSPVLAADPPVANPEPGTLLLLGSGFLVWALCRKRVKS